MSHSDDLPDIIPVFPLTGVLLLPGAVLPLHIFEERYRNLVADALDGGWPIGMIQPLQPRQDNRPPPDALPENPDLYGVGCAGRVDRWQQTPDGRYALVLRGVSRFRVVEELPLERGYRRVRADYADFTGDGTEQGELLEPERMLSALRAFAERQGAQVDLTTLAGTPPLELLNALAMQLPITPVEKQSLLEAPTVLQRQELLLSLLGMGVAPKSEDDYYTPPSLN